MVNRPPSSLQPKQPSSGATPPPKPGSSTLTPASSQTSGLTPKPRFVPQPVNKIDDTGLNALWLQDLILKTLYFRGYMSGFQVAETICLPFVGIVDNLVTTLKRDKLIEVLSSTAGFGEARINIRSPAAGCSARAKRWIAVSMPVRRRCRSKCITTRFLNSLWVAPLFNSAPFVNCWAIW